MAAKVWIGGGLNSCRLEQIQGFFASLRMTNLLFLR
jgi:hypothetical protein